MARKQLCETNSPSIIFVIEYRWRNRKNSKWSPWTPEFGNRYYYPAPPPDADRTEPLYERRATKFISAL